MSMQRSGVQQMSMQQYIPSLQEPVCKQQSSWKDNISMMKDMIEFMKDK